MFDGKKWRAKWKEKNPTYETEKKREQRRLDKELGIKYRGWEAMPGESFGDFKRRLKSERKPKFWTKE